MGGVGRIFALCKPLQDQARRWKREKPGLPSCIRARFAYHPACTRRGVYACVPERVPVRPLLPKERDMSDEDETGLR